jgi:sugar lactone lactonase YvrE
MASPYFAIEPCSDNEHDPTDQDGRASFPDKDPSEHSRQQTTVPPLGTAVAHRLTGPCPDSLRVDADGNVYAAMYDQGPHSRIQPARHFDRAAPPFTEVRLG